MHKLKFNYKTSAIKVCLSKPDGAVVSGFLVGLRLKRPVDFYDIGDFLIKVESILDAQNHPQAFQRKRMFSGDAAHVPELMDDSEPYMTEAEVDAATGHMTFMLNIVARQNTTWQGHMVWDDGQRDEFVSDLELMQIIDKRLFPLNA